MCSFIVVHKRSITKCDLINNSIKTHIYKRFFSKIEELRNYVKKKNGHRNNAMNSLKNVYRNKT
jgi:hypothetical protein